MSRKSCIHPMSLLFVYNALRSISKRMAVQFTQLAIRAIHAGTETLPRILLGSENPFSSFVHPSDVNLWPGLKPFVDTRLLKHSSSATKRTKETGRTGGSNHSAPPSESRGPALVSQSDLFLRCKVEADDQSLRVDRGKPSQKESDRDREAHKHRGNEHRDPTGVTDRSHKNYSRNRSMSPTRPYTKKFSRNGSDGSRRSELDSNRSTKVGLFSLVI